MNNNVCIPLPYFIIVITIVIILIIFTNKNNLNPEIIKEFVDKKLKFTVKKGNDKIIRYETTNYYTDPLIERDIKVLTHPLKAPLRRVPRHVYPNKYIKKLINIPTQGHPDNYHHIGNLTRENDEKIIKLFGRQYHPGSSQWEYYGTDEDANKFSIETKNRKELYDDDDIAINVFNKDKGLFKVHLYEYNTPRYNPYDY